LKTPLSAIVAASEIMRDERLGPMGNQQYLGYARDIHESAAHALAVITKMLTRATSEADAAAGVARVDLNDLAARTVSSMQALAAERDLTLDVDLEEGLLLVSADETAVRQILINLLANAFKFTPPGGDIRVVTGYQMNGSAFLVVRDTGEGMDQATIDEVFNSDAGKIGARRGGGYGIGLPLVRRLAQQIGADIEIDSAPLKGTVVLLSFPKHLLATA
jgi:two-component system cell cycle sensor histidine kinase PleC